MWSNIIRLFSGEGAPCRLCRAPAERAGLCRECAARLPAIGHACRQCGLPLHDPDSPLCGECLGRPPPFDAATVPFLYAPPLDGLIARLKYTGELTLGRLLAGQVAPRLSARQLDLLLPMPLHRARLRQRGFNQAAELCRALSRETGIPWAGGSLLRIKAGDPQRGSSRRQRQRNVRNAFRWAAGRPCPPRVALVDDVITTGATARAAAACLKRAGAEWVEIWAIARTPKGPGP